MFSPCSPKRRASDKDLSVLMSNKKWKTGQVYVAFSEYLTPKNLDVANLCCLSNEKCFLVIRMYLFCPTMKTSYFNCNDAIRLNKALKVALEKSPS